MRAALRSSRGAYARRMQRAASETWAHFALVASAREPLASARSFLVKFRYVQSGGCITKTKSRGQNHV